MPRAERHAQAIGQFHTLRMMTGPTQALLKGPVHVCVTGLTSSNLRVRRVKPRRGKRSLVFTRVFREDGGFPG